jgi:hypothetical protein
MSPELRAKLAQVAARIAATQERLRGLERSAASLRSDLESLRTEAEREAEAGVAPAEGEWGSRVPTRPLAVGSVGGEGAQGTAPGLGRPAGIINGPTAVTNGPAAAPQRAEVAVAPSPDDEPWPDR